MSLGTVSCSPQSVRPPRPLTPQTGLRRGPHPAGSALDLAQPRVPRPRPSDGSSRAEEVVRRPPDASAHGAVPTWPAPPASARRRRLQAPAVCWLGRPLPGERGARERRGPPGAQRAGSSRSDAWRGPLGFAGFASLLCPLSAPWVRLTLCSGRRRIGLSESRVPAPLPSLGTPGRQLRLPENPARAAAVTLIHTVTVTAAPSSGSHVLCGDHRGTYPRGPLLSASILHPSEASVTPPHGRGDTGRRWGVGARTRRPDEDSAPPCPRLGLPRPLPRPCPRQPGQSRPVCDADERCAAGRSERGPWRWAPKAGVPGLGHGDGRGLAGRGPGPQPCLSWAAEG